MDEQGKPGTSVTQVVPLLLVPLLHPGLRVLRALGQHVLVEREICDEPLQRSVLVLKLPQAARLTHAQMDSLLLSAY
jgi:hypothetical protein